MQVSAQTRHSSTDVRQRAASPDAAATIADTIDLSNGRSGGQPAWSNRDESQPMPDRPVARSGHKTVFVARALSSTLNQLQIASGGGDFRATMDRSESAAASQTGSLDDLLSNFLSAA